MKTKSTLLNCLFILATLHLSLQINYSFAQTTFERTYPFGPGTSIHQISDGNFIVSYTGAPYDGGCFKMDNNGDTLWMQRFTNTDLNSIEETSDGGFVGCGNHAGTISGVGLIRMDSTGDTLWIKTKYASMWGIYPGSAYESFSNGYVYSYVDDGPTASNPFEIIGADSVGNDLWSHVANGSAFFSSSAEQLQKTLDSGFVNVSTNAVAEFLLIYSKLNRNGNTVWTKTLGDTVPFRYGYSGSSVKQNADGSLIITGQFSEYTGSGLERSLWAMKTDVNGDSIWTRRYITPGYSGNIASGVETSDGGYLLAGELDSATESHIILLKTNSIGDSLWSRQYYGDGYSRVTMIQKTNDGGFILVGSTGMYSWDLNETYILKIDSLGNTITGVSENPSTAENISVFPSPFTNAFTVSASSEIHKIAVFDLCGKLIQEFQPEFKNSKTVSVDFKNQSPGIYLVKAETLKGSLVKKIVKY